MKNLRSAAGILHILGWVLLVTSGASVPTRAAQTDGSRTYAIIAVDDNGVLAQADQERIQRSLVQYLADQGYVLPDQVLTDDVVHADVVFRVQIAWQDAGDRFAIVAVVPSYSAAGPPAAYATESPPRPIPWAYDDYYDYSYLEYAYSPFTPYSWTLFPFIPYYYDFRYHQAPPICVVTHPPPKNHKEKHHPPRWKDHTRHRPGPEMDDHRPLPWQPPHRLLRQPSDGIEALPPSIARHPWTGASNHRPAPPGISAARPLQPDSDHRPPAADSVTRPPPRFNGRFSLGHQGPDRPPSPPPSSARFSAPAGPSSPAPPPAVSAPPPAASPPPAGTFSPPPSASPRPAPPPPARSHSRYQGGSSMRTQER